MLNYCRIKQFYLTIEWTTMNPKIEALPLQRLL